MKKTLLALLFFASCASIQTLDGGEKDTTPPEVTSVLPENNSLNIKNNTVEFNFNEYIKAPKVNDVLIISPSQKIKPTVEIKNKKLTIKLQDSLLENTTYLIQLNGGVVDNNEGNPLDFYNYVFSTGSYIDSLKYEGYVYSYLNNIPLENYNIQLYKTQKDSIIINKKPDYIARSNESGFFSFSNLPESELMVAVFEDLNKNLLYDKEEDIALLKRISTLNNTVDTFYTFKNINNEKYKLKLLKINDPGIIKFKVNKPITKNITAEINNTTTNYYLNRYKDTITLYYKNFKDSVGINLYIDTLTFDFKISNLNQKNISISLDKIKSNNKELFINSNQPVNYIEDSIEIIYNNQNNNCFKKQISPSQFYISFEKEVDSVNIIFKTKSIKTAYTTLNKADTLLYTYDNINNNQLYLKINKQDTINYIAELLYNNHLVRFNNFSNKSNLIFKNINPGTYSLRIIYDFNNNNLWDTGDVFKNQKPEKIKLYHPIEIRNNWNKELIINLL